MNPVQSVKQWGKDVWLAWEQFMFTPADALTLAVIRLLAGGMLLYTHFVWTLELDHFFGQQGWLSNGFVYRYHDSPFAWSHLYSLADQPALLWAAHLVALLVFAALMIGWQTRYVAIAAFLLTVSYAHRASGALFGLDQINGMLSLYLAVGCSGDAMSWDAHVRRRRGLAPPQPNVWTNVAIRLMQIHLCIIYLFAGCGKLLGESWWDGTALWLAFANQEYQTLDMTWTATQIVLINFLTHVTIVWEVGYAALVWPRLTRPIMIALSVPLHLGIAVCMGMVTFGVIMIVANLAFVPPDWLRRWFPDPGMQGAANTA